MRLRAWPWLAVAFCVVGLAVVPAAAVLTAEVAPRLRATITETPPARATANATDPHPPAVAQQPVQTGIDVLIAENFQPLRNRRIGLLTNHTGRARDGRSTIDVLYHAPGVTLVKLFSPEHGIRGVKDALVPDGVDAATGLKIVSLYGQDRKPRPRDLLDLDALVFDIQDIGTRFYTYISTLGLALEACGESGKTLFVLDRPNPIGGHVVAGPVRDDEFASFIAYHPLPVRHGMTVGELALLYNGERKLGAHVEVIKCQGWSRDETYDRTLLLWVNPSPNVRSLTQALVYPGVGLLEATNLATGRGTDAPFERVGAPWIDPIALAAALNAAAGAGVRFVPIMFTPAERQYAGTACGGVQIVVTRWADFDPLRLGVTLAVTLRKLYPRQWQPGGLLKMIGDQSTYLEILAGADVDTIVAGWMAELCEFEAIRRNYLLY